MLPLVDTAMTAGRGTRKISADAAADATLAGLNRDVVRVGSIRTLAALHRFVPRVAARLIRDK
ncbi:MAG TPA: hypothetical protein VM677_02935 [Actinokineospora sp.]|nr:hypothetical protein [Actinokineospora sp.]